MMQNRTSNAQTFQPFPQGTPGEITGSRKGAEELLDEALVACDMTDMPSNVRNGLLHEIEAEFVSGGGTVLDLGGGVSFKNAVLSSMGMAVHVIDLFDLYYKNSPSGTYDVEKRLEYVRSCGVNTIEGDFFELDLEAMFKPGTIDVISMLHVLEHLHNFPRELLIRLLGLLAPGGILRIETPNAANIRKRIALLFGKTNYPDIATYYDREVWFGHVREYTVADYHHIAGELKKKTNIEYRVYGENYYGSFQNKMPKFMSYPVNLLLHLFPGLCGSIFLEITKR